MGIDWTTDTYDAGAHLNVYGAEKLTRYFGRMLSEDFGVPDRRSDTELCAVWQERIETYYTRKNENK